MTLLTNKIKQIIKDEIHRKKCVAKMSNEQWAIFDIEEISQAVLDKLLPLLQAFAYIPCCHTSGMHDPEHYKKGIICKNQKAEAFERFCKDLTINPVTKSKLDCYWCMNDPTQRDGEGVKLFCDNIEQKEDK